MENKITSLGFYHILFFPRPFSRISVVPSQFISTINLSPLLKLPAFISEQQVYDKRTGTAHEQRFKGGNEGTNGGEISGRHMAARGTTIAVEHRYDSWKFFELNQVLPKAVFFKPDYGSELPMGHVENSDTQTPPRFAKSESPGVGSDPATVYLTSPSKLFWCTCRLQNHHRKPHQVSWCKFLAM